MTAQETGAGRRFDRLMKGLVMVMALGALASCGNVSADVDGAAGGGGSAPAGGAGGGGAPAGGAGGRGGTTGAAGATAGTTGAAGAAGTTGAGGSSAGTTGTAGGGGATCEPAVVDAQTCSCGGTCGRCLQPDAYTPCSSGPYAQSCTLQGAAFTGCARRSLQVDGGDVLLVCVASCSEVTGAGGTGGVDAGTDAPSCTPTPTPPTGIFYCVQCSNYSAHVDSCGSSQQNCCEPNSGPRFCSTLSCQP